MKRLGLLALALALGCNATSDGDTDTDGNSGGGSGASETDNVPTGTATATESDSANTESASGATTDGTSSSSTTDASSSSSSGEESSSSGETASSSSSSSTGDLGPEDLCDSTDGTWDPVACGDYVCGIPNACEAIIPGCDCGQDANFVKGEGCVADDACSTFECGSELECVTVAQYCEATIPGVKGAPTTYLCMPMPEACADSVDCVCLTAELDPSPAICNEPVPDGLVVQFILP